MDERTGLGSNGTDKNMAEGCKKGNLPVPVPLPALGCALFWPSRRRRSPALESTRIWPQSMPCPVQQSGFGRMVRVCSGRMHHPVSIFLPFMEHGVWERQFWEARGLLKLDKSSPDLGWKTLRVVRDGGVSG